MLPRIFLPHQRAVAKKLQRPVRDRYRFWHSPQQVAGLRRLAVMVNVGCPSSVLEMGEVQAAAHALNICHSKSG
jgi:hypothetical protein